jgi:ParB/RepB/Spo0J family partition protein
MAKKRIPGTKALFEETEAVAEALVRQPKHLPQDVPVAQLVPSRFNPRHSYSREAIDRLTRSVLENGFIGSLDGRELPDGRVELAYGTRRLLAARQAGLRALPVTLHNWSDAQMCLISLAENLTREGLTAADEAGMVAQLRDELRVADQAIADAAGRPREWVDERAAAADEPEAQQDDDPDSLKLDEVVGAMIGEEGPEVAPPVYGLDVPATAEPGPGSGALAQDHRRSTETAAPGTEMSWMETGSTMLVLAADALNSFDPLAVESEDVGTALGILSQLSDQVDTFRAQLAHRL